MANCSAVTSILKLTDLDHYLDFLEPFEKQCNEDYSYVTWGRHNSQNDSYSKNGETIVSAPADSSDGLIKKNIPEIQLQVQTKTSAQFCYPAAPQIYHTAQSSSQSMDQTTFSTKAQLGYNYSNLEFPQNQYSEQKHWEQTQYKQEYHELACFHPYNMQVSQVSSSSSFYGQPQTQKDDTRTDLVRGDVFLFKEQGVCTEANLCRFEPNILSSEKEFDFKDQKSFECDRQKILLGVQMPLTTDYTRQVDTCNLEMTSQYRLYDSPAAPPITNAKPANTTSSILSSSCGKGVNRKSKETKRLKTYHCTSCNKWFTSSGHLERHYNTALHGNSTNREVGSSVSQNNHMRGPPFVSTCSITMPVLKQNTPALTAQVSPPLSDFGFNSYSPRSMEPSWSAVPDSTQPYSYFDQNFVQTGIARKVMDKVINNPPIICESSEAGMPYGNAVQGKSIKHESNIIRSNARNIHILKIDKSVDYGNKDNYGFQTNSPVRQKCVKGGNESQRYNYTMLEKTTKLESNTLRSNESSIQVLNMENLKDYTNKENCLLQMNFPAKLRGVKTEVESRCSPAISSTVVNTTLAERKQVNNSTSVAVHKCYMCNKSFNKGCYLTQHNNTYHSGVKPFKCIRCGKRFSDTAAYSRHCMKHSDNKPFKCTECPKSFNHKSDLRRHMCLHADYMPFTCDHCGKGFIRNDHMIKHCATHEKRLRSSISPTSTQSVSSTS